MSGIGTPALNSSGSGGGGSVTQGTTPWVVNITQVGGSSLALGQALAAASLPVVLTVAQISTLTPPSNTGYALDSSLSTIDTDIKANIVLAAGTHVIGHVIADSGSTTAVTGNVATTIADGADVTLGSKADAKSTATDTTSITIMQVLKQISASVQAPPSQAVTNGGTFAVQAAATLAAETTKVIGVVRNSDGAGNLLTSNSTTPSGKFALDTNITSILGTAPTTAGFIDIKGADGNVFVRQATAANLKATVDFSGSGTGAVAGPTTSGSSLTANPLTVGGLAKTALPTAVSDEQVVNNMLDKYGRQITIAQAPRDLVSTQTTTISNSTAETTIVTAAASIFNDLVSLIFINTSASATRVDLRDATAGTIIGAFYLPAGDTRGVSWNVPLPQTTVNTNWTITCGTSVADVRILAQFIKNR